MNKRSNLTRRLLTLIVGVSLVWPAFVSYSQDNDSAPAPEPVTESTEPIADDADVGESRIDLTPKRSAYVILIEGEINGVSAQSLQRRADLAVEKGADVIVLEMNTPGGAVMSAMEMCTYIKNLEVETIAWVNPDAYSAGAMISLACDSIIMSPRSRIGDCAPIIMGQQIEGTERAKIESPIIEEFRDSANKNGYDMTLCEAMIRLGPAVYKVRNTKTEQVRYVPSHQLEALGLDESDVHGLDVGSAESVSEATASDSIESEATETKSAAKSTGWEIVKRVVGENQLLTLSQDEAVEHGFAKQIVVDRDLAAYVEVEPSELVRVDTTWSENIALMLASTAIRGILMFLFMAGVYLELQTAGVGLAGAVAAVALTLLLGAPFIAGLATSTDILLVLIGMFLVAIEVLVLPGIGLFGLLGVVFVFAGLIASFMPPEPGPHWIPQLPGTWTKFNEGLITLSLSTIASFIAFYYITKYFGSIPILSALIHKTSSAPMDEPLEPIPSTTHRLALLDEGEVVSRLRPVGQATFADQVYDVVTEGGWVDVGRQVRVLHIEGNQIVVEELH